MIDDFDFQGTGRRHMDKLPADIESLILQEDDPKQRAFLIVLNSINNNLIANTSKLEHVHAKLDSHLENYQQHTEADEAIKNKGKGAWVVAAWVLGLAQLGAVAAYAQSSADRKEILAILQTTQTSMSAHELAEKAEFAKHETRISILESRK